MGVGGVGAASLGVWASVWASVGDNVASNDWATSWGEVKLPVDMVSVRAVSYVQHAQVACQNG